MEGQWECVWSQQPWGAVRACLAGLMSAMPGADARMNHWAQSARWSGWERIRSGGPGVMWLQFPRCQHSPGTLTYTRGLCGREGVDTAPCPSWGPRFQLPEPCVACFPADRAASPWAPRGSRVCGVAFIMLFPQTEVLETASPQPCLLPWNGNGVRILFLNKT